MFKFFRSLKKNDDTMLSNISLIISDMDGTILNKNGDVYSSTIELITSLQQHNVQLMIATGRWHENVNDLYDTIGITGDIISIDGALIKSSGINSQTKYSTTFDTTTLEILLKAISGLNVEVTAINTDCLCSTHTAYLPSYLMPAFLEFKQATLEETILPNNLRIYVTGNRNTIEKVFNSIHSDLMMKSTKIVKHESKHEPGVWFIEIRPINANKGNAVSEYCQQHSIDKNTVLGVGDFRNDVSLLKHCGYKVALANAVAELRDIADFVTVENANNSGIDEILEKLLLIKTSR